MIRRVTPCLLSTSMHTVTHNRPLVPAGEQVQRVEELRTPAATGAVGMGVVYTSVHLFFPLLFFSFILWLTTREQQCQVWTCQGQSYSESQILAVVSTFPCVSVPVTLPMPAIATLFHKADLLGVFPSTSWL